MKKRAIVIISGLIMFLVGIGLIGLSNVTIRGYFEYSEPLGEPLEGNQIVDMAMWLPYAGKYGMNFTGSFQGHEGEPIFSIRDSENYLVFSSPEFDTSLPSNLMEFTVDEPGLYIIDFNIVAGNDSRLQIYQFKYRIGDIRPYVYLYYAGVLLAIFGIVAVVVGLFVLSKPAE